MFIKAAGFKNLMKEAWNRGILFVSRKDDEILIFGGSWIWCGQIDTIPNKVKAALVELTGELPDNHQSFKSGKNQDNQYEFTETIPWDRVNILFDLYYEEHSSEINETRVLLESMSGEHYRVYRNSENVLMLPAVYSFQLSNAEIMEDREHAYEGPFVAKFTDIQARLVYWSNSTSMLACFEVIPDDWRKDFMENMKGQVIEESRHKS